MHPHATRNPPPPQDVNDINIAAGGILYKLDEIVQLQRDLVLASEQEPDFDQTFVVGGGALASSDSLRAFGSVLSPGAVALIAGTPNFVPGQQYNLKITSWSTEAAGTNPQNMAVRNPNGPVTIQGLPSTSTPTVTYVDGYTPPAGQAAAAFQVVTTGAGTAGTTYFAIIEATPVGPPPAASAAIPFGLPRTLRHVEITLSVTAPTEIALMPGNLTLAQASGQHGHSLGSSGQSNAICTTGGGTVTARDYLDQSGFMTVYFPNGVNGAYANIRVRSLDATQQRPQRT